MTILKFRHLLEKHGLGEGRADNAHLASLGHSGAIVDATIIEAPSRRRTRSASGIRRCGEEGQPVAFRDEGHIVDAESGLAHSLLRRGDGAHGDEEEVWGDAGYQGVGKRDENKDAEVDWRTAMKPGRRRQLDKSGPEEAAEKRKASVRAKVEHPFLYVKRHFGYAKVRYRGLAKNRQRIALLPGFANLMIATRRAERGTIAPVSRRNGGKRSGRRRIRGFRGHFRNNRKHFSPWNGFPITKRVPDALRRSETGLDQTFPSGAASPLSLLDDNDKSLGGQRGAGTVSPAHPGDLLPGHLQVSFLGGSG